MLISGHGAEQWFTFGKSLLITPDFSIVDFIKHFIKITLALSNNNAYPVYALDVLSLKFLIKAEDLEKTTTNTTLNTSIFTQKRSYTTSTTKVSPHRVKEIAPLKFSKNVKECIGV